MMRCPVSVDGRPANVERGSRISRSGSGARRSCPTFPVQLLQDSSRTLLSLESDHPVFLVRILVSCEEEGCVRECRLSLEQRLHKGAPRARSSFAPTITHTSHLPELLMADTTPAAAVPAVDEEEQSTGSPEVLTSIFPPPPSHATRFTPDNLARLAVLEAHHEAHPELDGWSAMEPSARIAAQAEVLTRAVQEGEGTEEQLLPPPKWDVLAEMGPPRLDWIHEEGGYLLFGDRWPVSTCRRARMEHSRQVAT